MLLKSVFLLLPLLAKAAPAGLTIQDGAGFPMTIEDAYQDSSIDIDLEELRLVQFSDQDPPM